MEAAHQLIASTGAATALVHPSPLSHGVELSSSVRKVSQQRQPGPFRQLLKRLTTRSRARPMVVVQAEPAPAPEGACQTVGDVRQKQQKQRQRRGKRRIEQQQFEEQQQWHSHGVLLPACASYSNTTQDQACEDSLVEAPPQQQQQQEQQLLLLPDGLEEVHQAPRCQQVDDRPSQLEQRRRGGAARAALQALGRRVLRPLGRRLLGVTSHFRPRGVGHNDRTASERALNVVSCAPFAVVGASVLRQARGAPARRFGRMFLLVSAVATAYHAAPGKGWLRLALRVADHWTIALSSGALRAALRLPAPPGHAPRRALHPPLPPQDSQRASVATAVSAVPALFMQGAAATAAPLVDPPRQWGGGRGAGLLLARSLPPSGRGAGRRGDRRGAGRLAGWLLNALGVAAIPFYPSLVSLINFLTVEARCLSLAARAGDGRLLAQWLGHAALGAAAGGSFACEVRVAKAGGDPVPGMHAAWHVLSALAMLTSQPFVLAADRRQAAVVAVAA